MVWMVWYGMVQVLLDIVGTQLQMVGNLDGVFFSLLLVALG